jgi:hypothetical protein
MALTGSFVADFRLRAAAYEILTNVLEPLEEGQYPPAYRRHLARVLLDRLLTRICRGYMHDNSFRAYRRHHNYD